MNKYAILLLLSPLAMVNADDKPKAEGENFYREARLGDWVESNGGKDVVTKHTVVVKTEKELRIKIEQTIAGKASTPLEHIVDLTIPYPPPQKKIPDFEYTSKQEKLDSGKETLTIGDKKYDCEWSKIKTTTVSKFKGKETTNVSTSKIWRCPDVPLSWPVRTETELEGGVKVSSQIIDYGRGK